MAAAAGFPRLHITHQISFAPRPGDKQAAVALLALIAGIKVEIVAEKRVGFKLDIFNRMTAGTAAGNAESGLPFMAGAA